MRYLQVVAVCLLALLSHAEDTTVTIHIRLIDGRNGEPMKNQRVGLEDRAGYREIAAQTNGNGVAILKIRREAVILTHNTEEYVNCADKRGGLIHNDYKISKIVESGMAEEIVQPNECTKASGVASPESCFFSYDRGGRGKRSNCCNISTTVVTRCWPPRSCVTGKPEVMTLDRCLRHSVY